MSRPSKSGRINSYPMKKLISDWKKNNEVKVYSNPNWDKNNHSSGLKKGYPRTTSIGD